MWTAQSPTSVPLPRSVAASCTHTPGWPKAAFRAALDDALEELGLSAQDYVILSVFETRAELSTSELARITQVTRQTMHTAVVALESAGLLERRARNPRVVLVGPTRRGRKALKAATDRVRAVERSALTGLSRDDKRAVRNWLASLNHVHNKHSTDHGQVKEKRPQS
jgi:DNA-binding MarR family transcriptional regulator